MEINGFWKFVFFCFVGGTSALIHLIIFNICFALISLYYRSTIVLFGASLNYIISLIMGILISIIYNFSMNRNITFSAKHESINRQIPKYAVVYSVSIAIGTFVNLIVLNLLGENIFNANIANLIGILTSIPVSFFGSLLWTFKRK